MNQDVFQCMQNSHSVRNFQDNQISDKELGRILEAGTWAPSAGNLQPWYFFVVKNVDMKQKVAEACFDQQQVNSAPICIVVLADPAKSNERYGERGAQLYCLQDTAAAVQNMILAAEAQDISSCWVGAFDEIAVQKVVEAPPRLRAVAILCLGYGDETNRGAKERLPVAQIAKIIN